MIKEALSWLLAQLQALLLWLFEKILSVFALLFENIPVPSFLSNVQPFVVDGAFGWIIEPWNLEYIVASVGAAYVARFILRRIPIIG